MALQELPFTADDVKALAYSIMSLEQIKEFETEYEMNLAIAPDNIGRFRVNIFKQCNAVGMVIRHIQAEIFHMEDLNLPEILKKLVLATRELILFVGTTGVGTSNLMIESDPDERDR